METILVSVIMPVYNNARYISTSIDSALAQNVPLEMLIIDDGSTDGLGEVIKPYLVDSRVNFIKNSIRVGAAQSRNIGIKLAKGKYIAFLDADDYWENDKLRKQLALIEQTQMVLCSTARELMREDGTLTGRVIPAKTTITYRELCCHNEINCSSVLMLADVAREFFMKHDDAHEDYFMWLEVLKKYGVCCAVNEPLMKYRMSNLGKSGSKWNSAKMTYRTYRYMGFSFVRSVICFISYTLHGIWKYYRLF